MVIVRKILCGRYTCGWMALSTHHRNNCLSGFLNNQCCFSSHFLVQGVLVFNSFGYYEELRQKGELRKACSKRGSGKQPPNRVNTTSRLIRLRRVMRNELKIKHKPINAYLVTSDDEHQSEYVAPYDRRREYISGFSGTSGDAVITMSKAALWTDGRYHLQADDQLNCDWLLMRDGENKIPTISEWLTQELPENSTVGADPKLVPASTWESLEYELSQSMIELVEVNVNLIDLIWENHQENVETKAAMVLDLKYAGKNWTTKVNETRRKILAAGADAMVITALDEIAWLLNIRGRDVPYSPFVRSYVVLTNHTVTFYSNRTKLVKYGIGNHFHMDYGISAYSVRVRDYEKIWADLPTAAQAWKRVLLPWRSVFSPGASKKIYSLIPELKRLPRPSPIIHLKAQKNPTEIEGMKRAHIRDGIVMCKFLSYLESRVNEGDVWSELDVVKSLNEHRYEMELCLGTSFPTIVGYGPNGAQPHYEPSSSTNSIIFTNSTVVIDSGGQYYDGTTDVTRTIHLGTPNRQHIDAYTRVLIGHIQLSSLIFPSNMKSSVADVLARAPLWETGLDYMHATAHGIGSFLGVHESPIVIDYQIPGQHFRPGHFLSSEPGYYNENDFGIRLENVMEVVNIPYLKGLFGNTFLGFEDITLVPYEPKMINSSLLNIYHIRWLNNYNRKIREMLSHELEKPGNEEAYNWMMERTEYIPGSSSIIGSQLYLLITIPLCAFKIIVFDK